MTQNEKIAMIEAMRRYGGSFVVALADCFIVADADNTARLIAAFPEIVARYKELGRDLA